MKTETKSEEKVAKVKVAKVHLNDAEPAAEQLKIVGSLKPGQVILVKGLKRAEPYRVLFTKQESAKKMLINWPKRGPFSIGIARFVKTV